MTGLCRVCDCALQEKDKHFVNARQTEATFFVRCPSCQAEYYVDAKGDVTTWGDLQRPCPKTALKP